MQVKTSGFKIAVSLRIVDSNTEGPTLLSMGDRQKKKCPTRMLGVLLSDKAVSVVCRYFSLNFSKAHGRVQQNKMVLSAFLVVY